MCASIFQINKNEAFMKKMILIFFSFLPALYAMQAHAGNSRIVVSIKPLHSLVAAVMEGSGDQPVLLVDGKTSLHDFSLRPSQMKAMQTASLIFYIGDDFELFLDKTLASLPKTIRRVAMEKAPGLIIYNMREAKEDGHDHGGRDLHLWLMPSNARVMVMEIARQLTILFPEHKTLYFDNARKVSERLSALDVEMETRMVTFRNKPFIVFHDAYQYFETRYGLTSAGSIIFHPGQPPGAKHVQELRDKIKSAGVKCVFREPEFEGRVVDNLLEGTEAKSGVLDPEGALLAPGSELYFQLMEKIAAELEACLS